MATRPSWWVEIEPAGPQFVRMTCWRSDAATPVDIALVPEMGGASAGTVAAHLAQAFIRRAKSCFNDAG